MWLGVLLGIIIGVVIDWIFQRKYFEYVVKKEATVQEITNRISLGLDRIKSCRYQDEFIWNLNELLDDIKKILKQKN